MDICQLSPEAFCQRDVWLIQGLLGSNQTLVEDLTGSGTLTKHIEEQNQEGLQVDGVKTYFCISLAPWFPPDFGLINTMRGEEEERGRGFGTKLEKQLSSIFLDFFGWPKLGSMSRGRYRASSRGLTPSFSFSVFSFSNSSPSPLSSSSKSWRVSMVVCLLTILSFCLTALVMKQRRR